MKFCLLHLTSAKEDWAEQAEQIYLKKISAFFPIETKLLKVKKAPREDAAEKKATESRALLAEIQPSDYVVLFDEKGDRDSSREFAKKISRAIDSSRKRLVFIIGGAFGVSDEVKKRADRTLSLSDLTFNHLVAKTAALEQIYRSLTLIKNIPYHND